MKIINITPGLIQIPPNGWGAVEKIIWETHQNLLKMGYDSQIKCLNDLDGSEDIVHIHMANLANSAHERGVKYYFTLHDHYSYLYGKGSEIYKENLKAMQNAEKAFVPAKYLVEYFNNIPEYFSHGVNTDFFNIPNREFNGKELRLLCVANNGYANDKSADRKGFNLAIKLAEHHNLPITIAGPKNNELFFKNNPSDYDKLTIKYDLTEDELLKLYGEHNIFLHFSDLEAGHPNLTMLEALSCGLPVFGAFEKNNSLDGVFVLNNDWENIKENFNLEHVSKNIKQISENCRKQAIQLDWSNRIKEFVKYYNMDKKMTFREQFIKEYSNLTKINLSVLPKTKRAINKPQFRYNFIDGAFLEITNGNVVDSYKVLFIDNKTNNIIHQTTINNNMWTRTAKKYFIDFTIKVYNETTNELIFEHQYNPTNKRVYISLESSSLGDTLAWFPYVDEFRKKHNCEVICSTFINKFFQETYPEIQFVPPGVVVPNLYAKYSIGWFYNGDEIDYNKNPKDFRVNPLQQTSSDILGLEYVEIKPKVHYVPKEKSTKPSVIVAPHATAHAKYWNHPKGWQTVVNYINDKGIDVKMVSKEPLGDAWHDSKLGGTLYNVHDETNKSIDELMDNIYNSKFVIGVGSGVPWLAWAMNKPVIIISGFSATYTEMTDCERIFVPSSSICNSCFNRVKLDAGDWEWCPDHKNTPRQFECSISITPDMVIKSVDKLLAQT